MVENIKWQVEIKRLDKIRLDLELNFNNLELLTNINRSQLKKIFTLETNPSLKLYLDIRYALESQINVKSKVVKPKKEKKIVQECDCKLENGLFKRGKIKCLKSKIEHNF